MDYLTPGQFAAILAEIASKTIPKHPGRIYPRAVKQWRNKYPMAPRGMPRQKSMLSNVITIFKQRKKEKASSCQFRAGAVKPSAAPKLTAKLLRLPNADKLTLENPAEAAKDRYWECTQNFDYVIFRQIS